MSSLLRKVDGATSIRNGREAAAAMSSAKLIVCSPARRPYQTGIHRGRVPQWMPEHAALVGSGLSRCYQREGWSTGADEAGGLASNSVINCFISAISRTWASMMLSASCRTRGSRICALSLVMMAMEWCGIIAFM